MITALKNTFESATDTLVHSDLNTSLRAITKYAWLSAGALFALYLYFVGAITFSVISQEKFAQGIKSTVSEMSKEELQYLNAQRSLTEDAAYLQGFVSAGPISYTVPATAFAWNINARE